MRHVAVFILFSTCFCFVIASNYSYWVTLDCETCVGSVGYPIQPKVILYQENGYYQCAKGQISYCSGSAVVCSNNLYNVSAVYNIAQGRLKVGDNSFPCY